MKELFKLIYSFVTHRLFLVTVFICLLFAILFARLFELQIINGQRLEDEFDLSVLRDIDIEGQRGLIYDRNGYPLAINEIAYTLKYDNSVYTPNKTELILKMLRILESNGDSLSIEFPIVMSEDNHYQYIDSPTRVTRFLKDIYGKKYEDAYQLKTPDEIMDYLMGKSFFDISSEDIENYALTDKEILDMVTIRFTLWAHSYYKYIPQEIAKNISRESLAELKENKDVLPGISIVEDPIRKYLHPEYMAHVLGYTGTMSTEALKKYKPYGYDQNDIVGRIGIEEAMELYLHATDGYETVEVDNLGRTMNVIDKKDPVAGKDVYLTIDLDLQMASQDLLIKQLNSIIAQKLTMNKHGLRDDRVPELKEVYYSLFENKTLDLNRLLEEPSEGPYSDTIRDDYNAFYSSKTATIEQGLQESRPELNKSLERYYSYILDTLVDDHYLLANHEDSSGYLDYSNNNISFNGLLNYYIKEQYITLDSLMEKEGLTASQMSEPAIYNFLIDHVIGDDYFNRFYFKTNIMLEMLDEQLLNYVDLSMLLVEQDVVDVDDNTINRLSKRQLSPLNFMKQLIEDVKLTPQQLALDPSTGAVVVVDVDTGDVLSLVSYPSYDNNRISDYAYYQDLLNDPTKPLYPTATQGKTAPGSTFKMMSAFAGLEEGVISKNDYVTCTGYFTKVSPAVACWIASSGGSHGPVNVVTAIAVSCNSFFNEVGYRLGIDEDGSYNTQLGIDRLNKYVTMFGLDTTSGIELIESRPSTPGSVQDGIINPVTAAMGQEYNSYTPTQIARYIATVANGGTLYELTLIDKVYNSDGSIYMDEDPVVTKQNNFSQENVDLVHQGMKEVTVGSRGTARIYYSDFPVTVAGKTGTAQENKRRASHAVFASYAPADDPEIAIVVEIPYSYSASLSSGYIVGTLARDIYAAYYDIFNEEDVHDYGENILGGNNE